MARARYRITTNPVPDPVDDLRDRLSAEVERRGGMDGLRELLDHPDEPTARRAWWRLARVADDLDADEETWERLLRRAGWEPARPDEEDPNGPGPTR